MIKLFCKLFLVTSSLTLSSNVFSIKDINSDKEFQFNFSYELIRSEEEGVLFKETTPNIVNVPMKYNEPSEFFAYDPKIEIIKTINEDSIYSIKEMQYLIEEIHNNFSFVPLYEKQLERFEFMDVVTDIDGVKNKFGVYGDFTFGRNVKEYSLDIEITNNNDKKGYNLSLYTYESVYYKTMYFPTLEEYNLFFDNNRVGNYAI